MSRRLLCGVKSLGVYLLLMKVLPPVINPCTACRPVPDACDVRSADLWRQSRTHLQFANM